MTELPIELDEFFIPELGVVEIDYEGTILKVLFDNPFMSVSLGGWGESDSSSPSFIIKTSDVGSMRDGDTIVYDNKNWTIKGDPQPDSLGITKVVLMEDIV